MVCLQHGGAAATSSYHGRSFRLTVTLPVKQGVLFIEGRGNIGKKEHANVLPLLWLRSYILEQVLSVWIAHLRICSAAHNHRPQANL